MLRFDTVKTVIPYAAALAAEGKGLNVVPGTVLGELVRFADPVIDPFSRKDGQTTTKADQKPNIQATDEESLETWASFVSFSTGDSTGDSVSQHTVQMDQLVSQLSKIVSSHISYAKNTVRPEVIEMAEAIQRYNDTNKTREASEVFNIKVNFIPAPLKDDSFLDTLSDFKTTSALEPQERFQFVPRGDEELQAFILTGHARTDKLIGEWLMTREADFLKRVWENYFCGTNGTSVYYNEMTNAPDVFDRLNTALAHFLISRKLLSDVQETDMTLNHYKITAGQHRDYSGSLVVGCLTKINAMYKNNVLVTRTDPYAKTIFVNGELYESWLSEGGTPETLLGLLITGDNVTSKSLIDQQRETYQKRWATFENLHRVSEQNKAIEYFRHFVLNQFIEQYKDTDEIEADFLRKNSAYMESAVANVKSYLDGLLAKDLVAMNHYDLSLLLIAKYRFAFTSSYQILGDIARVGKENQNADVREAALLATINYVADYLADQMTVVR